MRTVNLLCQLDAVTDARYSGWHDDAIYHNADNSPLPAALWQGEPDVALSASSHNTGGRNRQPEG